MTGHRAQTTTCNTSYKTENEYHHFFVKKSSIQFTILSTFVCYFSFKLAVKTLPMSWFSSSTMRTRLHIKTELAYSDFHFSDNELSVSLIYILFLCKTSQFCLHYSISCAIFNFSCKFFSGTFQSIIQWFIFVCLSLWFAHNFSRKIAVFSASLCFSLLPALFPVLFPRILSNVPKGTRAKGERPRRPCHSTNNDYGQRTPSCALFVNKSNKERSVQCGKFEFSPSGILAVLLGINIRFQRLIPSVTVHNKRRSRRCICSKDWNSRNYAKCS